SAKALPSDEAAVVVAECGHPGPRLSEPERRFNQCNDAGVGHRLIVIRSTGSHMNMRIKELHSLDGIPEIGKRHARLDISFGEGMTTTHNFSLAKFFSLRTVEARPQPASLSDHSLYYSLSLEIVPANLSPQGSHFRNTRVPPHSVQPCRLMRTNAGYRRYFHH